MPHSAEQRDKLRGILEQANLLQLFPRDEDVVRLVGLLRDFFDAYSRKAQELRPAARVPSTLDLDSFIEQHDANPERVHLLLQGVAFCCSPDILAMMWMVVSGARVAELSYRYVQKSLSRLEVVLQFENGARMKFSSDRHWDAAALRFAGLSLVDEQPMIDSFYPLRLGP